MSAALSRRSLVRRLAGVAAWSALGCAAVAAESPLVALVHTQAAGDSGVVDGMIAGLKRIGHERNLTVRAIYAGDPANYQPILELLGEAGAAIVITTFNEMTEPLKAVAPAFPKTRFVQLYGDPVVPVIRNLRTVSYETYLACYLAGVCGGKMSQVNRLGYIGGVSVPTLNACVNALSAGARSVHSALDVSIAFVGSFQDPAKALQIADQMFGGGIDYIQSESAGSDLGIIQAANDRPGRIVSGGSRPQFALGPASVAAVVLCDFGLSLYQQTGAALSADWTCGHYRSGLQDGVVDFVTSTLFVAHGPPAAVARFRAAWPQIAAAKSRIVAGTLRVPLKTALG